VIIQIIINGLIMGSIYSIMAFGMVLIYRTINLMNFFHGSMYMLGALLGYQFYAVFKLPALLALPLAVLAVSAIGGVLERVILRPLSKGISTRMVIGTVILGSSIINNLALGIIGPYPVNFPSYLPFKAIIIGNIVILPQQLVIGVTSIILGAALYLFLRYAKLGKTFRAMSGNVKAAQLMGVNTSLMRTLTFGFASGLGALSGLLVGPLFVVTNTMGDYILMKAFVVAVLGGLSSMPGAIVGGLIVGLVDAVTGYYLGTSFNDLWSFLIMAGMLMYRPNGMFGANTIEKV